MNCCFCKANNANVYKKVEEGRYACEGCLFAEKVKPKRSIKSDVPESEVYKTIKVQMQVHLLNKIHLFQTLSVRTSYRTTSPSKREVFVIGRPPSREAPHGRYFGWVQRLRSNLAVWTPSRLDTTVIFKPHKFRHFRSGQLVYSCGTDCRASWIVEDAVQPNRWVTMKDSNIQAHTCGGLWRSYDEFYDNDVTLIQDDDKEECSVVYLNGSVLEDPIFSVSKDNGNAPECATECAKLMILSRVADSLIAPVLDQPIHKILRFIHHEW